MTWRAASSEARSLQMATTAPALRAAATLSRSQGPAAAAECPPAPPLPDRLPGGQAPEEAPLPPSTKRCASSATTEPAARQASMKASPTMGVPTFMACRTFLVGLSASHCVVIRCVVPRVTELTTWAPCSRRLRWNSRRTADIVPDTQTTRPSRGRPLPQGRGAGALGLGLALPLAAPFGSAGAASSLPPALASPLRPAGAASDSTAAVLRRTKRLCPSLKPSRARSLAVRVSNAFMESKPSLSIAGAYSCAAPVGRPKLRSSARTSSEDPSTRSPPEPAPASGVARPALLAQSPA
mmetsp:Transcript_91050/g.271794  ORF Transcript_91050/g.271794 Transcript_91050/m.271794 type:complete len:296 (+) Transcript_91050:614-1501(+)